VAEFSPEKRLLIAFALSIVNKGLGRQDAHRLVGDLALQARSRGGDLAEVLKRDGTVVKYMSAGEVDAAMDPERYLGASMAVVEQVAKKLK